MVAVFGMGDSIEQVVVAGNAAAILGRTGAGAGQTSDGFGRSARQDFFDEDFVLPTVTEVILVDQPVLGSMEQVAEPELLFLMVLGVRAEKLRERILGGIGLIGILPQAESVQVTVGPAKGQLQKRCAAWAV